MVYVPAQDGHWTWFVGFVEKNGWQIQTLEGIFREELATLEHRVTE